MKKTYTIIVEDDGKIYRLSRKNDGFSPLELLGILELTQLEIKAQMAGEIKPDFIKREVVKEDLF